MKAAIGPSEQGILGFRYPEHGLDGRIWAQGWHILLALPIFHPKRRSVRSSKGGISQGPSCLDLISVVMVERVTDENWEAY